MLLHSHDLRTHFCKVKSFHELDMILTSFGRMLKTGCGHVWSDVGRSDESQGSAVFASGSGGGAQDLGQAPHQCQGEQPRHETSQSRCPLHEPSMMAMRLHALRDAAAGQVPPTCACSLPLSFGSLHLAQPDHSLKSVAISLMQPCLQDLNAFCACNDPCCMAAGKAPPHNACFACSSTLRLFVLQIDYIIVSWMSAALCAYTLAHEHGDMTLMEQHQLRPTTLIGFLELCSAKCGRNQLRTHLCWVASG